MYVCMYICMYLCICIYVSMYVCMYIDILYKRCGHPVLASYICICI